MMGVNPSKYASPECPVENVSWNQITEPDGFLDQINSSEILKTIAGDKSDVISLAVRN